ncbi:hypothetical protein JCM6882_006774, partial [Rhodosporidiobolus microsporus]
NKCLRRNAYRERCQQACQAGAIAASAAPPAAALAQLLASDGVALDVVKVFPSMRVEVLLEELRNLGAPPELVRLIESFMRGRTCRLHFEWTVSDPLDWESGPPQGSPLSPILFFFYNAALLLLACTSSSSGFGWVDDLNFLVWGDTTLVTIFRPRNTKLPTLIPHIVLRGVELAYSPSLTMLGTVLDKHLTFAAHRAASVAKASKVLQGVALLSRARAGLAPRWVRQLVMAVVEPRLSWMAELGVPGRVEGYCTPGMRRVSFRLALRALSATPGHPLEPLTPLARPARVRKHPSPLHRALHAFPSLLPPSLQVKPIIPSPLPPWAATPAYPTLIAPSKEEAVAAHQQHLNSLPPDALLGYSDSSLLEGSVGASSVVMVTGRMEAELVSLRVLGSQQIVWAGEAEGARLTVTAATPLAQQLHLPSLTLLIDNQALLLRPIDPSP